MIGFFYAIAGLGAVIGGAIFGFAFLTDMSGGTGGLATYLVGIGFAVIPFCFARAVEGASAQHRHEALLRAFRAAGSGAADHLPLLNDRRPDPAQPGRWQRD